MNDRNPYSDPAMNDYFSHLPPMIKESIWQSGAKLQTLEELKSFVTHLTQEK